MAHSICIPHPIRSLLVTLALTVTVVFGCVGVAPRAHAATRVHTVELTTPLAVRVTALSGVTVWSAPRATASSVTLPATTPFGTPRVLLATATRGTWLRVLLPTRPNGATGWIRARDVTTRAIADEVRVDLAAHTLTWWHGGSVVLETPVAIGAPETPTPAGTFFVTDLLQLADAAGAYGPFALGLSAHSDTLSEFAGGDGQIGVHGTDAPWSIGQSVSHGCVRVPNEVVERLAHGVPLGTRVVIGEGPTRPLDPTSGVRG